MLTFQTYDLSHQIKNTIHEKIIKPNTQEMKR